MSVKVVILMNNKNTLLTTAILSYIWKDKKIDNIELLRPFVLSIIASKYSVSENINEDFIIKEMERQYAFYSLPLVILQSVLNRLSKIKFRILKKENNRYILIKDINKEKNSFLSKKTVALSEINKVVIDLKNWLIGKEVVKEKFTNDNAKTALLKFLEKNGYVIAKNIDNVYKWNNQDNIINYQICKYILYHYEKETEYFDYLIRIIEGFMITNVMYLQFYTNNNQNFNGVEFYLDSPLLLRVLGFKTEQENRMANELISLLLNQKAKIKCFEHNYKEVQSIVEFYRLKNFKIDFKTKKQINETSYEQTLELFDNEDYREGDIEIVLAGLRSKFAESNIEIVDCPNIPKNEEYIIDFKGLKEHIKKSYTRQTNEKTIDADIESVNAINILRKGAKYSTVEDSKAAFVTLNHTFISIIDNFFNTLDSGDVSLSISDVHLTSLLWMKNNDKSLDFPKMKLISSARAGFEVPNDMTNRIKNTLLRMEKCSPGDVNVVMNKLLTSQTSYALMEITGGDINKINKENIFNAIEKEKNEEICKKTKQIKEMGNKLDKLYINRNNDKVEKERKKQELIDSEISAHLKKYILLFNFLYYLFVLVLIYITYRIVEVTVDSKESMSFLKTLGYLFAFAGDFVLVYYIYPLKKHKRQSKKWLSKIEHKMFKEKTKKYDVL